MSRVFVASDLHLGHENMAKKRGFTTTEEHDEHIIKCWNSVVTKRDTVYCLGDLTMETSKHYHLLTRLNGLIRVIGGNHDKPKDLSALLNCVHSFSGMITYKGWILTHCPIHPKELEYRFKGNIHGHVHENSLDDPRYKNVSMENIDYTPVLIETLKPI
jgi:calcineurin-like phosphoesterase family protein